MAKMDEPSLAVPESSAWNPPAGLKDHRGESVPRDRDFFIAPPGEIGKIFSAASDARVGKALWPIPLKVALALVLTAVAFGAGYAFFPRKPGANPDQPQIAGAFLAMIVGAFTLAKAFKATQLSYVGENGAAFYSTRGNRAYAKGQLVHFAEIAHVDIRRETIQEKMATTTYKYVCRFLDENGQERMRFKGEYIDSFKGRLPRQKYDFVVAAEEAWKRFKGS